MRAEYALLIFTAVNSSLSYDGKYITNLALFILLIILLLVRNVINFEQKWYKYRAVTESIKTTKIFKSLAINPPQLLVIFPLIIWDCDLVYQGYHRENLTNTEAYVNSLKTESYRLGVVFYIIDRQTPT